MEPTYINWSYHTATYQPTAPFHHYEVQGFSAISAKNFLELNSEHSSAGNAHRYSRMGRPDGLPIGVVEPIGDGFFILISFVIAYVVRVFYKHSHTA